MFDEETYAAAKKYTDTHGSGGTAVQSDWDQTDDTADDYIKNKPDLSGKADKVSSPTSGNFAALDSNGNLTDSGKKAADFATPSNVAGEEIAGTATSTSITLTDSADGYVQGITIKGKSRKTKNLLKITATTRTDSGITFTVNSDGTIIANGTATANAYLNLDTDTREYCIEGQSYVLSGSPGNKAMLYTGTWSDGWNDMGAGSTITYSDNISKNIYIVINANTTVNNVVIKPMICTAADYAADPTFEPYFDGIKSVGDAGWGVVDLGTLTWTMSGSTTGVFYGSGISDGATPINNGYDGYCSSYNVIKRDNPATGPDKSVVIFPLQVSSNLRVCVKDTTYTDAAAFKTAMSGVLLYYPLADATGATPTLGITSKNGEGQGTAATITTGLPLRSTLDGTVYDELTNEKVITRCEVVEGEVVPLATPTETPLTSTEKSALASLRTYDHTTHIDATDAPSMTVNYLLNTNNGKAVANVDNKIGEKYTTAEKTKLAGVQDNATANDVIDTTVTLTVNGWVGNDAPYTQTVNVANVLSTDQAIVDLSVSSTVATGLDEIDDWALISKIETGSGTMTFTCYEDKPTTELTANVHIVRGTSSGAVSPTLKSVTWTGTGTTSRSITFPEKPTLILSIQFTNKDNSNAGVVPFRYGVPSMFCMYGNSASSWSGSYASALTYSVDELTMTITGSDKGSAWNDETTDYILYYM